MSDDFAKSVHSAVDQLLNNFQTINQQPIERFASAETVYQIRRKAIPLEHGRPTDDVINEFASICDYRMRFNSPRFFGFIPSPSHPISWLGDSLAAGYNTHSGGWFLSSGQSTIEDELLKWLAQAVGLPSTASGVFVSGGSMANLTGVTAARDNMVADEDRSKAIAYLSEPAHTSNVAALKIVGLLPHQIRRVSVDSQSRIKVDVLNAMIQADRKAGRKPFLIIANLASTNTGAVDPLDELAQLAQAESMWLHVDGAYGSSAALSKSYRHVTQGAGKANSISWDAHKWLFQTFGCAIVLVQDRSTLSDSFGHTASYTRDAIGEEGPSFWDYTPELTRPSRVMRLWFTLQVLGTAKIGEMIDHGFKLAEEIERCFRERSDWEIVSPAQMAIVLFRFKPANEPEAALDRLNASISKILRTEGVASVMTTHFDGKIVLRICSISPNLPLAEIEDMVKDIDSAAQRLLSNNVVG